LGRKGKLVSRIYSQFLFAIIYALTVFFSRWRRITILARLSAALSPKVSVQVNDIELLLYTPDRRSVYWPQHGFKSEPGTLSWIDSFSSEDIFYDIGANVGIYSLYAAKKMAVNSIAFEPNPFSHGVLAKNIGLNQIGDKVIPLTIAVGNKTEQATFGLSGMEAGSVGNAIAETENVGEAMTLGVLSMRLDELISTFSLPSPTHIKLDVDGLEPGILKGAKNTISRPSLRSVLVEFRTHDEEGRRLIHQLLTDADLVHDSNDDDSKSDNRLYVRNNTA
jgi:FkbM family methyltransferase